MKKHHLYYSWNLDTKKDGIEVWKGYRRNIPKVSKNQNNKHKEEKNYEPQKIRFQGLQRKVFSDYQNRYSTRLLEKRAQLGINPKLYLKISFFDNINEESSFFTDYNFKLISKDELLKEYIIELGLNDFGTFSSLIDDFIQTDGNNLVGAVKMVSLIDTFSIITDLNRKINYCKYFEWEDNLEFNINFFSWTELNVVKDTILAIAPNVSIVEEGLDSLLISEKTLKKEEFETMLKVVDTIRTTSSWYYDFKLNQRFESEVEFDKNIIIEQLSETVCVVDSWIEDNPITTNLIDKDIDLNYSFDWSWLFTDKWWSNWHGTWVASIIMFGNILSQEQQEIKPVCKVCSVKVVNDFDKTSDNFNNIISKIEEVHLNSDKSIKLFNLSIGWGYLWYNKISEFWENLDLLMHRYDILCIISAGNLCSDDFDNHANYPNGWHNVFTNLNPPAESISWVTVWSISCQTRWEDYISFYSAKDNYKFPNHVISDWERKKYRKKPDLVTFWGDGHSNHFWMLWPWWNIVYQSGTSFSAPYVTHMLVGLKNVYPNVRMTSIKALLANRVNLDSISKPTQDFYIDRDIDIRKIYGNGIMDVQQLQRLSYWTNDDVSVIFEDSMDFSSYDKQNYPFLTVNIKMPQLEEKSRFKKLLIKATLCYNPIVVNSGNISEYNPCFLSFNLHEWEYDFTKSASTSKSTGVTATQLTSFAKEETWWSDSDYLTNSWNNLQTKILPISKSKYNDLVREGLQITVRWRLKDDVEVVDYYKEHAQMFSLVLNVIDMDESWVLYEEIQNKNDVINASELSLQEKISI